jgi:cell division protein FtsB
MAKPGLEETTKGARDAMAGAHRRRPVVVFLFVLVALGLVLDGVAGERGWLANRRARLQYEAAVQALESARQENEALREEARRLREDPAAIEEAARRDLGFIKPGEKVFIVRDVVKDKK